MKEEIKLKKNLEKSKQEPWYDLDNEYIKPKEMCENPEDAKKIIDAVTIVQDFFRACEEQIPGFLQ